jgi:ubiquinol-cytochrome c reductase iron-sulfur subunit
VAHVEDEGGTRRDFLYVATAAAGAVAVGAAVWPMVNQMNPSADVQALASIQVDVSALGPGSQLTVLFLGKPVFIRRRTAEEIAEARADDGAALPDTDARNVNLGLGTDASDANRTLDEAGEWLVMIGVCTHLGCVPLAEAGDYGGWFCPCHGSHYDKAGRIRRGPAPENMHIPVAEFVSDGVIQLGYREHRRDEWHSPRPLRAEVRRREVAREPSADPRPDATPP